jgi:cell division protein FtsQ
MQRRNIRLLQRRKKRRRVKAIAVITLSFIITVVMIYVLITNYIFVRNIVFAGNYHIKDDELLPLINIKKGDRLLGVSKEEIYRRLKMSPWVEDAVIRKDLSGQIFINIIEAVPLAILSLSDKKYLIDKKGKILEPIKNGSELFLSVIKDIDPAISGEAYREAIRLANLLHGRDIFPQGSIEILGNRIEDLSLKVDKLLIKIGNGDYDKKLERLKVVKKEIESRNIQVEYIDLRFSDRVIVKPLVYQTKEQQEPKKFNKTKKTKNIQKYDKKKKKR